MPTSNDPLLVGLDVGTTNIKAVIFDMSGQPVAQASVSTPTYYPQPSWAYYKAEELWQRTVEAIRLAVAKIDDPGRIVSVAAASMGEAGAPIDAHGQPTYDVIAWFDQRTQPQIEWLDRTIGKDRLFDMTGLSLQPIFGLGKLLWLKENQPDAFARTVRWLNMADYIAYRLCGVPATDYSLASRTMALDLRRLQWADDLLQEVGLPADLFAPACVSGTRLGPVLPEVAAITGLPTTAQVATGGHDHVCGALAVGVTEPGSLLNSLGTAENLFLPLNQPLTDPEMGRQGYTQGVHVVPGQYYVFGASYTSGACVDWLRQIFGGGDYAALIAAAEQVPPGSLGVCFLPHLRLANPPYDDPLGRGAFIGLSTDVKPATLFRAVLEGLAYESHYVVDSLLKFMDTSTLHRIHAIGGGTRNRLLMQLKATVFNQPVIVTTMTEATSLGAALLGGLGAGVYADVPAALGQLKRDEVVVEPLAEQVALYETYFRQVYQQLYLALRPLHHTIYQLQN
ncbi:MAG: carbohydrate kinase [Anaerolineales bacterium]|nr:carbohydrate kinase [Anaerolineales bacterium]